MDIWFLGDILLGSEEKKKTCSKSWKQLKHRRIESWLKHWSQSDELHSGGYYSDAASLRQNFS